MNTVLRQPKNVSKVNMSMLPALSKMHRTTVHK